LSGPDSGSIRAEIIRHVWAFIEPKEFNPHSNEARATLLGWLLRTAKVFFEYFFRNFRKFLKIFLKFI